MTPPFTFSSSIVFEVNPLRDGPRWILNTDKGYTGQWASGSIYKITPIRITTLAAYPDGEIKEDNWPNYLSSDFEEGQWSYPGYLAIKDHKPLCDCGCGDDSGFHWQFCPLWAYLRQ